MVLHAVLSLAVAFISGVLLRPAVSKIFAKFDATFYKETNAAKLKVLTEVTKVKSEVKSKL